MIMVVNILNQDARYVYPEMFIVMLQPEPDQQNQLSHSAKMEL